jgi:hypothetical protein
MAPPPVEDNPFGTHPFGDAPFGPRPDAPVQPEVGDARARAHLQPVAFGFVGNTAYSMLHPIEQGISA